MSSRNVNTISRNEGLSIFISQTFLQSWHIQQYEVLLWGSPRAQDLSGANGILWQCFWQHGKNMCALENFFPASSHLTFPFFPFLVNCQFFVRFFGSLTKKGGQLWGRRMQSLTLEPNSLPNLPSQKMTLKALTSCTSNSPPENSL